MSNANIETEGGSFCFMPNLFAEKHQTLMRVLLDETHPVQESRTFYGRTVDVPRLTRWFGPCPYRFGGSSRPARSFGPALDAVRRIVSLHAERVFNSCLVNVYRDGSDGVAWHTDDEPEMGPVVASVSLGAARKFKLRHNETRTVSTLSLGGGSLYVMGEDVQPNYQHCVPKTKKVVGPRMNLTFREARC